MKIIHDQENSQFRAEMGPYRAILMYARREKLLDFYHIYIPDPFRGRGIAGKILIHAFEYAQKEGCRVVPSCPFIAGDFLKRFPKYQELADSGQFPFAASDEH